MHILCVTARHTGRFILFIPHLLSKNQVYMRSCSLRRILQPAWP